MSLGVWCVNGCVTTWQGLGLGALRYNLRDVIATQSIHLGDMPNQHMTKTKVSQLVSSSAGSLSSLPLTATHPSLTCSWCIPSECPYPQVGTGVGEM